MATFETKKLTERPASGSIADSDVLYAVVDGSTKPVPVSVLRASVVVPVVEEHAGAEDPHGDRFYVASSLSSGVRIKALGAISGQNATAQISEAAALAISTGVNTVIIDIPDLVVDTSTDCLGCRIVGHGATISAGTLVNTGGIDGVVVAGIKQGAHAHHPRFTADGAVKGLLRVDDNTIYVFVRKPSSGYALLILRNNATTNTASLASAFNEPTPWRICSALDAVEVLVGYTTSSGSSGTWTQVNMETDVPEHTSGTIYKYIRSPSHNAWIEFTITVPADGKFNIGFLCTSGSSTSVTIYVDDAVIDAIISLSSTSTERRLYEYVTTPGSRRIRVQNNLADSSSLNILGVNFSRLATADPQRTYDTIGWYRNSANIDPLDSNSANDYAVYDLDSSRWGGSYHGGENNGSLSSTFIVGGVNQALPAVGKFMLAHDIRVRQASKIDWHPYSAAYLNLDNTIIIHEGGFSQKITFSGSVRAKSFFTTLFGMSANFESVIAPVRKTLADITANAYFPIGVGGHVVYEQASGKTRATIEHSQFTPLEVFQGGSFLWRVPASYNKFYYGPVVNGNRTITNVTAVNRFVME